MALFPNEEPRAALVRNSSAVDGDREAGGLREMIAGSKGLRKKMNAKYEVVLMYSSRSA
jgi:hypothetical protein